MIIVLQAVAIVCAVVSSLFFVLVYSGWMRALRTPPARREPRPVSVIIAAHNEAAVLPRLLAALNEQDYPRDLFEIILVDDRSDDGTSDIAQGMGSDLPIRILRIDETPDGVSPKKWALHQGIAVARNDLLLLTDADCLPRPAWIRSMTAAFSDDVETVIGLAPLTAGDDGASRFAAFESRRTMALSISAAAFGIPYMASGRSWGFTRTMYERCGGLPTLYAHLGGDDDLLLQRMLKHGASVGVCTRQDAMVLSAAPTGWKDLLRQKLRHYRVSSAYRGRGASFLAAFVLSETLTPLAVVALTVLMPGPERVLPLLMWLWKLWYDTGFLAYAFRWMEGDNARIRLAFSEGFHIFFSALTGVTSYVKPPRW
ncbi:MAG: glycosyltransferase [Bacteroidetes bacterium]|nr:glycosyltransferase [Bacteroidota bacterium]